jgi:hypothetical protein
MNAELPENSPRYVILSYELNHKDGRKSFVRLVLFAGTRIALMSLQPLVLINWAPTTCPVDLLTLHASAFLDFQTQVRRRSRYRSYSGAPPELMPIPRRPTSARSSRSETEPRA